MFDLETRVKRQKEEHDLLKKQHEKLKENHDKLKTYSDDYGDTL